jgi:hypothetical protein
MIRRLRRSVLLLVLTVATVLGASFPANALFSDPAPVTTKPTIGTLTVAAPGNVRVETSCTTTTTVVKRVYDSTTNALVGTSTTRSEASSRSNVEGDSTVRTNGPQAGQYTLTQTIEDTELDATARWNRSSSRGVTGYRMTVFFADGTEYPMDDAAASATSMSDSYDADVVDLRARLSMVTLTSYGWTAAGTMSNVVTC